MESGAKKKKICHFGIASIGKPIIALCTNKAKPSRDLWTVLRDYVTCKDCLARIKTLEESGRGHFPTSESVKEGFIEIGRGMYGVLK